MNTEVEFDAFAVMSSYKELSTGPRIDASEFFKVSAYVDRVFDLKLIKQDSIKVEHKFNGGSKFSKCWGADCVHCKAGDKPRKYIRFEVAIRNTPSVRYWDVADTLLSKICGLADKQYHTCTVKLFGAVPRVVVDCKVDDSSNGLARALEDHQSTPVEVVQSIYDNAGKVSNHTRSFFLDYLDSKNVDVSEIADWAMEVFGLGMSDYKDVPDVERKSLWAELDEIQLYNVKDVDDLRERWEAWDKSKEADDMPF